MGYVVGVDLGTTFTAAAVLREGSRPETVQLGNRAASIPSTVFVREDDEILTGQAALRRGLTEPGRLAREFKRRFGDPTPLLLGGVPVSADSLTSRLLRAIVDAVSEREGGAPAGVGVCHPANWGPYKLDLLAQACRHAGLDDAVPVPEPEAAAWHYASQERIDPGSLVAVYDLGGGTFDAAVLRRTDDGFEIVGTPDGIERLGGIDFDEAVVAHVRNAVGDALDELDPKDPSTLSALARLREECVEAKEALSGDTEASVPVVLPGLVTDVRITRVEFESMIRVPLSETIEALRRTLRSAEVEPGDLTAVLLVGGSSRIPMVAEMVGSELGRPVAVDADPKHVVALGAARVADDARVGVGADRPTAAAVAAGAPAAVVADGTVAEAPTVAAGPDAGQPPPAERPAGSSTEPSAAEPGPAPVSTAETRRARPEPADRPAGGTRGRRLALITAAVVGVLALVGGALALAGGGGGEDEGGGGGEEAAQFVSTCPPDEAVCINGVEFDGDELAIDFEAQDVELEVGDRTPVFFLADDSAEDIGSAAQRTDDWRPWGPSSPMKGENARGQQGWTSDEIAGSRTSVCVLLGDEDGNVEPGAGNCADLPEAP